MGNFLFIFLSPLKRNNQLGFARNIYLVKIFVNVIQNALHQIPPLAPRDNLGEQICKVSESWYVGGQTFLCGNGFVNKVVADTVGFLLEGGLGLGSVMDD